MKRFYRFTAAILALILIASSAVLPAFAVSLPQGITAADVSEAEKKTEKLFSRLQKSDPRFSDLSGMVYEGLYRDETLSELFWGLYGALSENGSAFSAVGIDTSLQTVRNALTDFPEVQSRLNQAGDWNGLLELKPVLRWQVKNKTDFEKAVSEMLSPINVLLRVMLCSYNYNANILISLKGANGYENVIIPLLKALDCKNIMTQAKFTEQAKKNPNSMVANLLDMLFSCIDGLLENPVKGMVNTLPKVAWYLTNVGLSNAVSTLIAPLKIRVGLFQLSGIDKMLSKIALFSDAGNLTELLEKLDLSELTGSDVKFELPQIDLAGLARCCTCQNGVYKVDATQSYLVILKWLTGALRENKGLLLGFSGTEPSPELSKTLDRFLQKSDTELMGLVLRLLTLKPGDNGLEYSWSYPEYTPGTVAYTPNLTRENYEKVLNEIDGTLNEFLTEFGGGVSLSSLLAGKIYTPATVTMLVKELYGALYSVETAAIMPMLGLDISPKGLSKAVENSFPAVAGVLNTVTDYGKLDENSLPWGFAAGSRQGFEKALTAVLTPLLPALDFLLCEGSISVLDAITFYGSNGYNTAVIPLLEGLGCDMASVKTYRTVLSVRGTQKEITYILAPVFDLLDRLVEAPVKTLCELLPNLVYFYNSGAIDICIKNLLYPVNKLTELLGVTDLIPAELTDIGEQLSLDSLMGSLTGSGTLPIQLKTPDLTAVQGLGSAQSVQSNRTYNGLYAQTTVITADAPAVLLTVLRYFVDTLKSEENSGALSGLMGGTGDSSEGMPDMFAMYAGNITDKLSGLTTDETVEWLYDLLFAETPTREEETTVEALPEIIFNQTEDKAPVNYALIAAAAVILLLAIVILLSKIDFNGRKEKRERKKLNKKNAKAQKKQEKKNKKAKNAPSSPAASTENFEEEKEAKKSSQSESAENKEDIKRRNRQEKAVKRAIRESKKADKYYEQALREASKKK